MLVFVLSVGFNAIITRKINNESLNFLLNKIIQEQQISTKQEINITKVSESTLEGLGKWVSENLCYNISRYHIEDLDGAENAQEPSSIN